MPLYVQTGTPVAAADGRVAAVEVTFNQAIAPATFTADDVLMRAPDGTVLSTTVVGRSPRLWRSEFAAPAEPGFFSLLVGPEITDPLGRQLDQDQDGQAGEAADGRYEAGVLLETPASPAPAAGSGWGSVREAESAPAVLSDKFLVTSYSPSGERPLSQLDCSYFIHQQPRPDDRALRHRALPGCPRHARPCFGVRPAVHPHRRPGRHPAADHRNLGRPAGIVDLANRSAE